MIIKQHQTFSNAFKSFAQQVAHRSFILTTVKFRALALVTPIASITV
jgi:hypothetical protein